MDYDVTAFINDYTRRYIAQDIDGVTDLCLAPFLAVREGRPVPMPDRAAIRDHFATVIGGYQKAGYASFAPVEIATHYMGERSACVTVRWHAMNADGTLARDSKTTYLVLMTESGWRFLSYTNHF